MGLMKRFSEVMKAKTSKMLDKAEDPRETLDYSYEKQLEMVQKVRRGLADVTLWTVAPMIGPIWPHRWSPGRNPFAETSCPRPSSTSRV